MTDRDSGFGQYGPSDAKMRELIDKLLPPVTRTELSFGDFVGLGEKIGRPLVDPEATTLPKAPAPIRATGDRLVDRALQGETISFDPR